MYEIKACPCDIIIHNVGIKKPLVIYFQLFGWTGPNGQNVNVKYEHMNRHVIVMQQLSIFVQAQDLSRRNYNSITVETI